MTDLSSEDLPFPPGFVVGSYRLGDPIGKGAAGCVYRCSHVHLGREAAIKLLDTQLTRNRDLAARFIAEARIVNEIRHPNIIDIFDFLDLDLHADAQRGEDARTRSAGFTPAGNRGSRIVAYVMELVPGGSLRDAIDRGPLRLDQAVNISLQLADAIGAAHALGVVHRDLKPENVLLVAPVHSDFSAVPSIKVLDFGIAKLPEEHAHYKTATGAILGTPQYMAPEQINADPVSPATDVYALGEILYEMLAGRRAHRGRTMESLFRSKLFDPPDLSGLSPVRAELDGVRALVEACLARAQEDRPSIESFRAALLAVRERAGHELTSIVATPKGESLPPPPEAVLFASGAIGRASGDANGGAATLASSPSSAARSAARVTKPPKRRALLATFAGACAVAAAGLGFAWWSRGQLPSSDRVAVVIAENTGAAEDAWIAPALSRMAIRRLELEELRFRATGDPAAANVELSLAYRRVPGGIELATSAGPAGGRRSPVRVVNAESVAKALDLSLVSIREHLGDGQEPRGPDAREREEMARFGATTFEDYRLFQQAVVHGFGTVTSSLDLGPTVERGLAIDPAWAHLHILRAFRRGIGSPGSLDALETGRKQSDATRDPDGARMLEAFAMVFDGKSKEGEALFDAVYRKNPDDIIAGFSLAKTLTVLDRADDAISVFRSLYERRPDLQFGSDLAAALRGAGRAAEIEPLVLEWLARVPDSEQAQIASVGVAIDEGDGALAVERAERLLYLHGDAPPRQLVYADALLAAGRIRDVMRVADGLIRGGGSVAARARRRLGEAAILEGRLASALESLLVAARDGASEGVEGEISPAFDAARTIAAAIGRTDDAVHATRALIEHLARFSLHADLAAARYDLALLEREKGDPCPDPQSFVAGEPGPSRELGRIHAMRAAATGGCVPCSAVVALGLAAREHRMDSLFRFARCAQAEGKLELARSAFRRTRQIRPYTVEGSAMAPSMYHAVLSRFHLGEVLEALGDTAGARAEYDAFLEYWGQADRPLAEVDAARAKRARLGAPR